MSKNELKVDKIIIHKLKGLKEVEIDLSEKPLIGIMGVNGVGKSTILHALACIYKPNSSGVEDHKFSEFFTPTTLGTWQGSDFEVVQSYRNGNNPASRGSLTTHFRKNTDRWAPRYNTRQERYVSYIGIRTCVPKIEIETQHGKIKLRPQTESDSTLQTKVQRSASAIMNRNYDSYNRFISNGRKEYIGVSYSSINYISLSMGAGEQRIFYIMQEILKSPCYGLILIDEIDLLLHQDALIRLMKKIKDIAEEKHLQIIFTTHAQSLLSLNFIAFRHLFQTPNKTLCLRQAKPDILQRLTGNQERPLEIFVEDRLASVLVKKVCSEEKLSKYVSIKEYGAAINCFTSVCGAILKGDANFDNMLFVLDGDVYRTEEDKKDRIKKVLTGTSNDGLKQKALLKITQFVIPENISPEKYYHSLIIKLNVDNLNNEQQEMISAAKDIQSTDDTHNFFTEIINRMDFTEDVGLSKLVDILALTSEWDTIKSNIKKWLDTKKNDIVIQ